MYQTIILITYPNNTTVHFKPVETADVRNFTPRAMNTQGHQQQTFLFILSYL